MLASPEQCVDWCSTHDLLGSLKGNNHKDSCLANMVARTTHSQIVLEIDLMDMATKHIMQDIQDNILYMRVCTILLEKCCVHIP